MPEGLVLQLPRGLSAAVWPPFSHWCRSAVYRAKRVPFAVVSSNQHLVPMPRVSYTALLGVTLRGLDFERRARRFIPTIME